MLLTARRKLYITLELEILERANFTVSILHTITKCSLLASNYLSINRIVTASYLLLLQL
jgi:hypothetical protein